MLPVTFVRSVTFQPLAWNLASAVDANPSRPVLLATISATLGVVGTDAFGEVVGVVVVDVVVLAVVVLAVVGAVVVAAVVGLDVAGDTEEVDVEGLDELALE
jgi:hypothetical protein